MVKEERLFFLKCENCAATCSVASIKLGFQAQVGKRAAQRAKAT
jgi:translation initiation factor 2 beta subunit (eIF-2beta)/eIF-5